MKGSPNVKDSEKNRTTFFCLPACLLLLLLLLVCYVSANLVLSRLSLSPICLLFLSAGRRGCLSLTRESD
jgi:hypothetical protein